MDYKSCYPSASAINGKEPLANKLSAAAARDSHILDDIQSQKSEEYDEHQSLERRFEECKSEDEIEVY